MEKGGPRETRCGNKENPSEDRCPLPQSSARKTIHPEREGRQKIKAAWEREIVGAVSYLMSSEDPQVKAAMRMHDDLIAKDCHSTVKTALKVLKRYDLHENPEDGQWVCYPKVATKALTRELKRAQDNEKIREWEKKSMHGRFARQCKEPATDQKSG